MAQIAFGSVEAALVLKRDRPLRAQAAREARIEKAKVVCPLEQYEVCVEVHRSVSVEAYSEEEASDIVEENHLRPDETIVWVTKQ